MCGRGQECQLPPENTLVEWQSTHRKSLHWRVQLDGACGADRIKFIQ